MFSIQQGVDFIRNQDRLDGTKLREEQLWEHARGVSIVQHRAMEYAKNIGLSAYHTKVYTFHSIMSYMNKKCHYVIRESQDDFDGMNKDEFDNYLISLCLV